MKDTFYVAKQAGDAKFLRWLHDRLEFVHGENPDVDYMHRLRDFVAWFEGDPLKGAEGKLKAAIEAANLASSWIALADARLERAEIAEAERDAAVAALASVIVAWESLTGNRHYSSKVVEAWLIDKMKPAIDQARAALASNSGDAQSQKRT